MEMEDGGGDILSRWSRYISSAEVAHSRFRGLIVATERAITLTTFSRLRGLMFGRRSFWPRLETRIDRRQPLHISIRVASHIGINSS